MDIFCFLPLLEGSSVNKGIQCVPLPWDTSHTNQEIVSPPATYVCIWMDVRTYITTRACKHLCINDQGACVKIHLPVYPIQLLTSLALVKGYLKVHDIGRPIIHSNLKVKNEKHGFGENVG